MRQELVISAREARRFLLSHLLLAGGKATGAEGVLPVFERLKCVQFDPLAVAGRNHDIVCRRGWRTILPRSGMSCSTPPGSF